MTTVTTSSMDLDDFENALTSQVFLTKPTTGELTTLYIEILGPEAPSRKAADFDRVRRARADFVKAGNQILPSDPRDDYETETDYLVASTSGWNLLQNGAPLPFSPDAARTLYTDPKRQWVRTQIVKAVGEASRFIKACANG